MAPKNKKKNSFYFFMKELQQKEARKGRNISMTQMPVYAHPIWKQMSLAEKEPYEEMARKFKNDPNLRGGKLASDGTRVEDNLWEEEEKQRLENKMKQDVKRYCNSDCSPELFLDIAPNKIFYFMSFNILCRTNDMSYLPIEVGIVEYSIKYGIHKDYTEIIYPGEAPSGYAADAVKLSETKHEISVYGVDCKEKDFKKIYNKIKDFTNPLGNDEWPPIFCARSDILETKGCLEWLARATGEKNLFEVWDATYLLLELRAGIGHPLPSYAVASDLLAKTSFQYHPSTRCEFHEEKDSSYCAKAYPTILCYLLSDAVCNLFNIALTEKHIPVRAIEEKSYTVTVVKGTKQTDTKQKVRLDKTNNYYENNDAAENNGAAENKASTQITTPRQPASSCIAAEMNRLQLNITAATMPGHGIGRGIRRK